MFTVPRGERERQGKKNQEKLNEARIKYLLFLISRKWAEGGEARSSSSVRDSACPSIAAAAAAAGRHNTPQHSCATIKESWRFRDPQHKFPTHSKLQGEKRRRTGVGMRYIYSAFSFILLIN